jgi:hypothetical protein
LRRGFFDNYRPVNVKLLGRQQGARIDTLYKRTVCFLYEYRTHPRA